jgi:hypothetical protein
VAITSTFLALQCYTFFLDTIDPVTRATRLTVVISRVKIILSVIRFVWLRKKAQKLVIWIQKHTSYSENEKNPGEEINKNAGREAKLIRRTMLAVYAFLVGSDALIPLIRTLSQRSGNQLETNTTTERKMYFPVASWYPWITSNVEYYIICYIPHAYSYITIMFDNVCLMIFNLSVTIHVSAQLRILRAEFKDVRRNGTSILNDRKKFQIADIAVTDRSSRFRERRRLKNVLAEKPKDDDDDERNDCDTQNTLHGEEATQTESQDISSLSSNERDASGLMVDVRDHRSGCEISHVSADGKDTNHVEYIINRRLIGCINQHQKIIR